MCSYGKKLQILKINIQFNIHFFNYKKFNIFDIFIFDLFDYVY